MDQPTKPLADADAGAAPVGERVDRYVVLGRLGEGGSGEVFSAFDPVLDRKVAVKVLHGGSTADGALVREGRMLAKLSDPHVVTIHDVGVHEGRAFMAMELLEGPAFEAWCATRRGKERWREIVDALRAVGQGLAAAHAAGIVHGDVKPSNVLVDERDRIKVSDFGIARLSSEGQAESQSRIVGTPAFMSPEQHDLSPPDERSDQYSFCLLAWTVLTGELPFELADSDDIEGTTGQLQSPARTLAGITFRSVEALAVAKRGSLQAAAPPRTPVRIVSALRRGLAVDPSARWATMSELVEQLSVERGVPNWLLGAGALAVVGASVFAVRAVGSEPPPCQGAEGHLVGVWDDLTRTTVQQRFDDVGTPLAGDTWPLVRERLDGYAADWASMHRSTCEATNVRKEQSEEALDLRMGCLHRAKVALTMAGRVLADADASVVEAAPKVVGGLPPLERCEDLEGLRAQSPAPTDPATVAAVDAGRERLAEVRALMQAGRDAPALELVTQVREDARSVDYPPLSIEAALHAAHLNLAESRVDEAASIAAEGLDEALAAGAWIDAARISVALTSVADRQEQGEEALIYARLARGFAQRPGGDERLRSRTLHAQAIAEHVNGHYDDALATDLEALELASTAHDAANPRLATLRSSLANRYANLGRFVEGEEYAKTAIEAFEVAFGARHPQTLQARAQLGMLLARQGKLEASEALLRDVLRVDLEVRPPEHYDVQLVRDTLGNVLRMMGRGAEAEEQFALELEAMEKTTGLDTVTAAKTISNIATAQLTQGRAQEAERGYRRALEIAVRKLPPGHQNLGGFHDNLGNVLAELGRYEEAREQIESGIAIYEAQDGPVHVFVSNNYFNLAGVMASLRRPKAALEHYAKALEIREAALSEENPSLALARLGLGLYLLELHRPEEAKPLLAKAWKVYADNELPPIERGQAAFGLARVTEDPARARELAGQARVWLRTAGPPGAEHLSDVESWLAR